MWRGHPRVRFYGIGAAAALVAERHELQSQARSAELIAGATSSQGQDVYQRVYNSDGTYTDYFAGTFVWHPAHNHFHFNDYALYSLSPINAPGGRRRAAARPRCA